SQFDLPFHRQMKLRTEENSRSPRERVRRVFRKELYPRRKNSIRLQVEWVTLPFLRVQFFQSPSFFLQQTTKFLFYNVPGQETRYRCNACLPSKVFYPTTEEHT